MQRPEPRVQRIVASDLLAMLSALLPVVMWGLYVATAFGVEFRSRSGTWVGGRDPLFLNLALVATLIGGAVLVVRIRRVQALFAGGIQATGEVTSVEFIKDRGRVEYKFRFRNREVQTGAAVAKTAATSGLRVGQSVNLVVDPSDPRRALIVSLYT